MSKARYHLYLLLLTMVMLFGVFMCLAWYPFSTAVNMGYIMPDAIVNEGAYYTILSFYILASIPCFVIVAKMYKALRRYYRCDDREYMMSSIKCASYMLMFDAVLFLAGNIALHMLSLNTYVILYYILVAIALIMSVGAICVVNRYAHS